jgi:hypothetical protein
MTSVCSIVRQQKKNFKDGIIENEDDGGNGTESADRNPTRFMTAAYNEISISENISSVIGNPCIVHYGMLEDNYKKTENRWPRRCQRLATPSTSV